MFGSGKNSALAVKLENSTMNEIYLFSINNHEICLFFLSLECFSSLIIFILSFLYVHCLLLLFVFFLTTLSRIYVLLPCFVFSFLLAFSHWYK